MAAKKLKAKSEKLKVRKTIKTVKSVVKKVTAKKTPKASEKVKVETRIVVVKTTKEKKLSVSVFDTKGKAASSISLPAEIFNAKINDSLMSQAVRVYLANQRQGTVKTKSRGEVNRTTKKIYQQKGTGRARHGSRRAPIYVGGGLAFGPKPRDLSLNLSKKMKTLALFSALSSKLKDNEIKIIRGLESIEPKTKIMAEVLRNLGIDDDREILLVIPKAGNESQSVYRASRNIEGIDILTANTLNAYSVLDNKLVLLMKDSINVIKDTFVKDPASSRSAGLRGASKKTL